MFSIVLASGSTYCADLLVKLHLDFETCSSHFDETALADEAPEALVQRLSLGKAQAIRLLYPNICLLARIKSRFVGGRC